MQKTYAIIASCHTSMPHICSPSFLSIVGRFMSLSVILQSDLEGKGRRKTKISIELDTIVSVLVSWVPLTVSGGLI